jgi:hypothetical protein
VLADSAHGGPVASSVAAVIRAASINTGSQHRDEHLRTSDFFDVAHFPIIAFHSERMEASTNAITAIGPLTLHGQTRTIKLPLRVAVPPTHDPHHMVIAVVSGSVMLDRRDFSIFGSDAHNPWFDRIRSATMGDSVRVTLEIHLWAPDAQYPDASTQGLLARIDSLGVDSSVARLQRAAARDSAALRAAEYSLNVVGETLLERGRLQDAFRWLHAIARLLPGSTNAMVSVGLANQRMGDSRRAAAWYAQALAADSVQPRALLRSRRLAREDSAREAVAREAGGRRAVPDTRQFPLT